MKTFKEELVEAVCTVIGFVLALFIAFAAGALIVHFFGWMYGL